MRIIIIIYCTIKLSWSHKFIQVIPFRPLELMLNCHVLQLGVIVIGLMLGCVMMLSIIYVQLAYFEIRVMQLLLVPRVVQLTAAYLASGMSYVGSTD